MQILSGNRILDINWLNDDKGGVVDSATPFFLIVR